MSEREKDRLYLDKVNRPSTKWEFEAFFSVDLKVVLDWAPLLGTASLPKWLRNLAHGAG